MCTRASRWGWNGGERIAVPSRRGRVTLAQAVKQIKKLGAEMMRLARNLEFEQAAKLRLEEGRAFRYLCAPFRARSSAVEHFLDMEGVTGSIPVAPTNKNNEL